MQLQKLLVANRGEIAIRVMRSAALLGVRTVAVYSEDDAHSLHTRKADEAHPLRGRGPTAYLDADSIVSVAAEVGCDAVHPGYGFLSENAAFAQRCTAAGIAFVGPRPELLELFGDKVRARALAERCGISLLAGSAGPATLSEAAEFLESLGEDGAVMIKAVAGGGGRGLRVVRKRDELEAAYTRCQSEAQAAFGHGEVYVERWLPRARHIEVQIAGDGSGAITHFFERECSIQRRNQKIVEVAPCPELPAGLRDALTDAAVRMAAEVAYDNLGTFEFLIDTQAGAALEADDAFAFIEANPRLQVEHTVTEEVLGVDLVRTQLELADGRSLDELELGQEALGEPRGFAIQVRINMETMDANAVAKPSGGTLSTFEVPSGPGLRTDTFGYGGYTTSPSFDSLLAKVIGYSPSADFRDAVAKTYRGLCEFKIEGVPTNIAFLQSILQHPEFAAGRMHTRFVEEHCDELVAPENGDHRRLFFSQATDATTQPANTAGQLAFVGARIDANDPLAVLNHGKSGAAAVAPPIPVRIDGPSAWTDTGPVVAGPEGTTPVLAPLQGMIVDIDVADGDSVHADQQLLVMEAMKMEHVVTAGVSGIVRRIAVAAGDTVFEGHALVWIEEGPVESAEIAKPQSVAPDHVRADLAEVHERHTIGLDAARPDAVARRRKTGQRTMRENVEDLCDPGTLTEYGPLVIAAQRRRRTVEDLIKRTPADGMFAGIGSVNGDLFGESESRCVVMSYDYTVLAGTQGLQNHRKKDRLFELALQWRLPLVFFTEGGGGRPGDTDGLGVAGLDCLAFHYFGRMSGHAPLVGINSGRCFAGNAALLGCCDVVIATRGSNIGMGGPAMIEGGGLGIFRPDEVGPLDVQIRNGVVDIAVEDEAEAVRVAKKYLGYFQGPTGDRGFACADQRRLRDIIPENRLRIYDVREVIRTLSDTDSVLELRREFALGMVTALIRIEGRPVGVIANNPAHLAGAIDSDGADKAARFMQLCDAYEIPLLFLCDTPGIMVGPDAEKTALVRHASRMFVIGASLTVPFFTIVLRKGYGLGAQAMAGGSFKAPFFTVAWPTGEFGGMGLEGAVKLGFRKELAAIEDAEERRTLFESMVERMYAHGKAVSTASHFEIDDVIDPVDSRSWIVGALRSTPNRGSWRSLDPKRPCVDTW